MKTSIKHIFLIKNALVRELMSEFFGTGFVIAVGEAACMSALLNGPPKDVVAANLAWGFAVYFAILMCADISGALFNPAIVITWAIQGKIPWRKVLPYSLAETFGAFCGAAVVFGVYYEGLNHFDGGIRQIDGPNGSASVFATYPAEHVSALTGFFDQVVATACLVIGVLATFDPQNGVPSHLAPMAVGFYVMLNGYTFTTNSGGAINPARDLGPRLFTAIAGWGWEVFSYRDYNWFWVPILGPIVGSNVGAAAYYYFIEMHRPPLRIRPVIASYTNMETQLSLSTSISKSEDTKAVLEHSDSQISCFSDDNRSQKY